MPCRFQDDENEKEITMIISNSNMISEHAHLLLSDIITRRNKMKSKIHFKFSNSELHNKTNFSSLYLIILEKCSKITIRYKTTKTLRIV